MSRKSPDFCTLKGSTKDSACRIYLHDMGWKVGVVDGWGRLLSRFAFVSHICTLPVNCELLDLDLDQELDIDDVNTVPVV